MEWGIDPVESRTEYDATKEFQWKWGVSLAGQYDSLNVPEKTADFSAMVDELYASARWKVFTLDAGMKHVDIDFLGVGTPTLGLMSTTGGHIIWSGNARTMPGTSPDDYIPSQIIAEYIRYLGYDGIRYSSSLHEGGFNLTIFDTSKCEAVSSTDLRLEKIKISMRPALGAQNIDNHFEYIVDNIPKKLDPESGRLVEAEDL